MKRLNSTLILSVWVLIIPIVAGYADAKQLSLDAEAYNNQGLAWSEKKDYEKAIADLNKAIEINPGYAEAYSTRGAIWMFKGDLDQALTDAKKALSLNPQSKEYL